MDEECLRLTIVILRTLLESAAYNDRERFLGWLRPPSKLSRKISRELEEYKEQLMKKDN